MPDKLTDSEIVKALKEVLKIMCVLGDLQKASTISNALDLINRLQAEKMEMRKTIDTFTDIGKLYSEIKAEAVKEFWEELKHKGMKPEDICDDFAVGCNAIDKIYKELVGEDK